MFLLWKRLSSSKISCMKIQLDQMTLLLEKNNINLPEGARKRDNQDKNNQPERLHMVASKYSFSSLDSNSNIPIHMGDYSQITSKGKGTVKLELESLKNVLYVPSLASNVLFVYQMTHTSFPKRVTFIPNDVDI